ncbi:hypothetical protein OCO52_18775 [Achromobacter mucicolens]|uniref:hypothetical protein n=1 Tax=Achromobacter mucicolens TaxID=1389922 RepID=UPI0021CE39BF|nr:hypothetical protein [Achromobacter mucicolens]MCU6618537.1 hypothetical protein [Achromobacter mucicolens]
MEFWNTLGTGEQVGLIGVIITFVALLVPFYQTVLIKGIEARRERYLRYHAIIRQINVDDKEADGRPFIDMQIAAVFELTLLPEYHAVSLRILRRIKRRLTSNSDTALAREVDLSIAKIERSLQCRFNSADT